MKSKHKKNTCPTERVTLAQIIRFLKTIPNSRLIRLYNAMPYDKNKGCYIRRSSSLTPSGLPDLLFDSRELGAFFFEVKTKTAHDYIKKHMERLRREIDIVDSKVHVKNQIRLIDEYNSRGNIKGYFVSSVDDVIKALNFKFEGDG